MRIAEPGQVLLALSVATLGTLLITVREFALAWQPIPKGIVGHDTLVNIFGSMLLACGIGVLAPRAARAASLALAGILLLRVLVLKVPNVVAHPLIELVWYDLSENLALVAGAWIVFSMLPRRGGALARLGHVRAGQILFALALPAIGLAHFFYVDKTAPLIPPWIPLHVPLAYLAGLAHIAAGAGILFGVLPRLAATLEAVMVSLFTLLVWVPRVIDTPANLSFLAEICVSAAIAGAAWAVARSFRDESGYLEARAR